MKLIGISGKSHAGKDTCAEIFKNILPDTIIVAFADELKRMVARIVGCSPHDLYDQAFKALHIPGFIKVTDKRSGEITHVIKEAELIYKDAYHKTYTDVTYREALQFFGEKCRKVFGRDYWIKVVDEFVRGTSHDVCIIPDVRYINEAEYISSKNGILVRVNRPLESQSYGDHASETELDNYPFTYVINNDKDLDALEKEIKILIYKANLQ